MNLYLFKFQAHLYISTIFKDICFSFLLSFLQVEVLSVGITVFPVAIKKVINQDRSYYS
jgi:hypothetical protein